MTNRAKERSDRPSAPSRSRSLHALVLCGGLLIASAARAQPRVVTEADVLAAVRSRDPEALLARAAIAASRAREASEGRYPNPSVSWSREHIPGDGPLAVHEDTFALSFPIELGGARSAQSALAEAETAEARSDATLAMARAAHRALALFYEALAARERAAITGVQLERLAEAERVLARRVAEGSAPGYELARLQLEAELARSALSDRETSALAKLTQLASLLGVSAHELELRGELATTEPAKEDKTSRALREARTAEAAASRAQDSARTAWVPPLVAQAGPRLVGSGSKDAVGYVAGLSLELPVFDRKQGLSEEAAAERARLAARREAIAFGLTQAGELARNELERAHRELARFEQATSAQVLELERAAQASYREGQSGVLELLDAQRVRAGIEVRKLELRLLAKQAELNLRAARGELEGDPL